jgi:hypothetical protein
VSLRVFRAPPASQYDRFSRPSLYEEKIIALDIQYKTAIENSAFAIEEARAYVTTKTTENAATRAGRQQATTAINTAFRHRPAQLIAQKFCIVWPPRSKTRISRKIDGV